jgi:hypothetical protein
VKLPSAYPGFGHLEEIPRIHAMKGPVGERVTRGAENTPTGEYSVNVYKSL